MEIIQYWCWYVLLRNTAALGCLLRIKAWTVTDWHDWPACPDLAGWLDCCLVFDCLLLYPNWFTYYAACFTKTTHQPTSVDARDARAMVELIPIDIKYTARAQNEAKQAHATSFCVLPFLHFAFLLLCTLNITIIILLPAAAAPVLQSW